MKGTNKSAASMAEARSKNTLILMKTNKSEVKNIKKSKNMLTRMKRVSEVNMNEMNTNMREV